MCVSTYVLEQAASTVDVQCFTRCRKRTSPIEASSVGTIVESKVTEISEPMNALKGNIECDRESRRTKRGCDSSHEGVARSSREKLPGREMYGYCRRYDGVRTASKLIQLLMLLREEAFSTS